MGVWGWIVLYVLLFSLLQLAIYRYLRSDEDAPLFRSTPSNADSVALEDVADFDAADLETSRTGDERGSTSCPRCGTDNEPGYTYCRNCVSPMTAR